ncbi:MAG: DNA methyltransferase [Saprospiraceae bacterium]
MDNYKKLQDILSEIFEIDKADLDFGIYRIMNQKREQVLDFINKQLPKETKDILAQTAQSDSAALQKELDDMGKQLDDLGVVKEDNAKYISLKAKIEQQDTTALEQDVFSHLATFFKRYYKEGDFISMRRYKKDVYAIPYEGEEVKLHWANADQYYIKTSEYLKNYNFKLGADKLVQFQLKEASTEQNNNKAQGDQERRFAIFEETPIEVSEDGNTLFVNFTYEPHKKSVKQTDLTAQAIKAIQENLPPAFADICANGSAATESNKNRTLLDKHLNDFISRNSFDYFIHKDLGGFLNRELDFYIKNEVLYIDDIDTENPQHFLPFLGKVKAIKTVAQKIIVFLAQIEDFQKKLWLKKKLVISTDYCITLDKIPETYYQEITENKAQLAEWITLFGVTVKTVDDLKDEPYLVLDTKFFSQDFKDRLLAEFDNLDEETDGLLINSENFQALNLLQEKYKEKIKGIYIDPPYNAKSSEILYKNTFKHSSWLSFIFDRIYNSKVFLNSKNGVFNIAIDENEQEVLGQILSQLFENYNKTCVTIIHNASGQQGENFSYTNEYSYFLYPQNGKFIGFENRPIEDADIRGLRDVTGEDSKREAAKNCFYPIFVREGNIIGFGDVCPDDFHPKMNEVLEQNIIAIYPIDPQGIERKWRFARQTIESIKNQLKVNFIKNRNVYDIQRIKTEFNFKTVWTDSKYFANNQGTQILNNIVGKDLFSFPKSIYTVFDSLKAIEFGVKNPIYLDYFAGSGTTGHATIKLNREDGGKRKYILVEMGAYFNTVTKPRIQKVIYTDNWKNGKPQDTQGISQMFKYQVLESYEDVLNNLKLGISQAKQDLFSEEEKTAQEYLLKYMLDVESKDQLFNMKCSAILLPTN